MNAQMPNVMGYLSFAHQDREVVKTLGRLVIGSLSYWINRTITITQECVICGSVYVDEQNLGDLDCSITQPRANPTEQRVGKDKDIESLDLPEPAELKSNITIPPAAIHLTVRCG